MNSLQTNLARTLHHFLLLATFIFALVVITALTLHSQQLRPGIAVSLAETHSAAPFPDADQVDAWIIAITRDGSIYFGTDKMTSEGLREKMRSTPRRRGSNVYIKADAQAPFTNVRQALDDARDSFFDTAVLLTAQPDLAAPVGIAPPRGLIVSVGTESSGGGTLLELVSSGEGLPTLRVNGEQIERRELKTTLAAEWPLSVLRICTLKADGQVEFQDVAHVVDVCRALGAKVILPE